MYHDTNEVKVVLKISSPLKYMMTPIVNLSSTFTSGKLSNFVPNIYLFNIDWTTCSKFVDDSRPNGQRNMGRGWSHLHDRLTRKKLFTLIVNRKFIRAPKFMRKMALCTIHIC